MKVERSVSFVFLFDCCFNTMNEKISQFFYIIKFDKVRVKFARILKFHLVFQQCKSWSELSWFPLWYIIVNREFNNIETCRLAELVHRASSFVGFSQVCSLISRGLAHSDHFLARLYHYSIYTTILSHKTTVRVNVNSHYYVAFLRWQAEVVYSCILRH